MTTRPMGSLADGRRRSPAGAVVLLAVLALAVCAGPGWAEAAEDRALALDRAIPAAMARAQIPGAIVGVWQDGREPYVRAFGVSDTATGAPMTTDMHMRIGSTSKSFVVTAILMLADQGKLGLDDTIDAYVEGVPNGDRITLRHLAAMRSGLFNYGDETNRTIAEHPFRQWTPQQLLDVAFAHPPLFPPGSAFDYSNTNTVLLGLVVERVSGRPLKAFIEEMIARPAGLTGTVFPVGAELPEPFAHGYADVGGRVVDATHWNPSWGWAAGSMISTLEDLRLWTRAFAEGRQFSPQMKIERDRFLAAPGEGEGSLYGLGVEYENGWIGHNGNPLNAMTYPYFLPSDGITLVVMVNSAVDVPGSWRMMQEIVGIVSPNNPWPNLPKP